MNHSLALVLFLSVLIGVLNGALYFSILWWSVSRLVRATRPVWVLVTSFVLRISISVAVFGLILGYASWMHLLAALLGFFAVRTLFIRVLKPELQTDKIMQGTS